MLHAWHVCTDSLQPGTRILIAIPVPPCRSPAIARPRKSPLLLRALDQCNEKYHPARHPRCSGGCGMGKQVSGASLFSAAGLRDVHGPARLAYPATFETLLWNLRFSPSYFSSSKSGGRSLLLLRVRQGARPHTAARARQSMFVFDTASAIFCLFPCGGFSPSRPSARHRSRPRRTEPA